MSNVIDLVQHTLSSLDDVDMSSNLTAGRVLSYDGAKWVPTAAAGVKGYITFNGITGVASKQHGLTVSKSGTGVYVITCDPAIRDGTNNWCVVIGNVDTGILLADAVQTSANDTLNVYNAFVTDRTIDNFTISATRKYNNYMVFSASDGDGNATQMFGITSVDPSEISLAVF
jgi:hypothetical protein